MMKIRATKYCVACLLKGLILLGIILGATKYAVAGGCGSTPGRPSTPSGCSELELQCVCDENGTNCHWQWVCAD